MAWAVRQAQWVRTEDVLQNELSVLGCKAMTDLVHNVYIIDRILNFMWYTVYMETFSNPIEPLFSYFLVFRKRLQYEFTHLNALECTVFVSVESRC